jgi:hypothetical protein
MAAVTRTRGSIKASTSFLKKRSKKLLFLRPFQDAGQGLHRVTRGETKVFCFFFSKKKSLP